MNDQHNDDINVNADKIIEISSALSPLGLKCELCGSWLWVHGDTKPHKELIKSLGCRWSVTKKLWYWRPADQRCFYRRKGKEKDLPFIRAKYGSLLVEV